MSERITRQNVEDRVANVNRRMREQGAAVRYAAESRNGYIGLDRLGAPDENGRIPVLANVTCDTKREVADFLHAMMVALDDAKIYASEGLSASQTP